MTWDEIYEAADGKACGEWELKRKDTARYEVVCFVEDNFGINLETECENVEEEIDYYVEKYGIIFDKEGKIIDRFLVEDEIVDIMYNNYEKEDLTQYNKNKHIEYMIYDEYTSTDSNVPENLKSLGIDFTYYKQLSGVNYNGRELKPMYSNLIKTNSTSQIYSFSKSQQGIFQEFIDSLTSIKLTDEEIDNFIEGLNLDINNYDKYEIAQQCVELTKDEDTFFSVIDNIDMVEMDGNLTLKTLKHAIKQGIVGDKHNNNNQNKLRKNFDRYKSYFCIEHNIDRFETNLDSENSLFYNYNVPELRNTRIYPLGENVSENIYKVNVNILNDFIELCNYFEITEVDGKTPEEYLKS